MATNRELLEKAHWNDLYLDRALAEISEVAKKYIVMQGEVVTRGEEDYEFILPDTTVINSGAVAEAIEPLTPNDPPPILSDAVNVGYSLNSNFTDRFELPVGTVDDALDAIAEFLVTGEGVDGEFDAEDVSFDPAGTTLDAGNVQAAVEELDAAVAALSGAPDLAGVTTLLSTNVAISADGAAGVADPLSLAAGWHFKNTDDLTEKINWYYLGNDAANSMTLGDLDGQHALVTVRAGGAPYFIVYTRATGSGDAGSWYKSRRVYAPAGYDLTAHIGETVLLYWGADPGGFPGTTRVECTLDGFSTNGSGNSEESILFGNVSTSSSYPAGHFNFVMSDLGYTYAGKTDLFQLAAPSATEAPATPDNAYIELDGVNDYISLSGTGGALDFSATWSLGLEIVTLPTVTTDNKFMNIFRSGNAGVALRRGGSNWGLYLAGGANGYYSVGQANTWYAPQAGSKILFVCDGVRFKYYLDGVMRANIAMNATYRDSSEPVSNSLEIGRGGIGFAQGTHVALEGGVDNLLLSYNVLSSAEIAEWFAGNDVTNHSYYGAARDFVPLGEAGYPNVTGEKNNVTGTLVNGTADDFKERN